MRVLRFARVLGLGAWRSSNVCIDAPGISSQVGAVGDRTNTCDAVAAETGGRDTGETNYTYEVSCRQEAN